MTSLTRSSSTPKTERTIRTRQPPQGRNHAQDQEATGLHRRTGHRYHGVRRGTGQKAHQEHQSLRK